MRWAPVAACCLVEPSREAANAYLDQLLNWVADFEAKYSRFLDGSLISRINAAAGKDWVEVDEETDRLFNLCDELFFLTRGAFDPTALPLIRLWNWKAQSARHAGRRSHSGRAGTCRAGNKMQRRPGAIFLPRAGMCLDLGGIGKEYAVDMAWPWPRNTASSMCWWISARTSACTGMPPGRPAWHVGLENPPKARLVLGQCGGDRPCRGQFRRLSPAFRSPGRRYGHIIDPRTGHPVGNGCLAVNVVAPTCTIAGILVHHGFHPRPDRKASISSTAITALPAPCSRNKAISSLRDSMNTSSTKLNRGLAFMTGRPSNRARLAPLRSGSPLSRQAAPAAALKDGDAFPDLGQVWPRRHAAGLKGKIVLVDFFASWCGPCKESFPVMQELHKKYAGKGLVIIAINLDKKKADMDDFLKKHPATSPSCATPPTSSCPK